jgi:predicted GNAT family acetyltransferase
MSRKLTFRPVTRSTRAEFEAFFSSPGAPKWCWCMVWRRSSAEAKQNDPVGRKRQMMKRIEAGAPVGLIAHEKGEPVGWVSIAPRDTYRNLGGPEAKEGDVIWSIACFYVPRKLHGEGLVRDLIAGAVKHAKTRGATIIEAYPVPPDAQSYRFMGFIPVFEEAGFKDMGMAGVRRHVMRKTLN